jgi:hypothetical protein
MISVCETCVGKRLGVCRADTFDVNEAVCQFQILLQAGIRAEILISER